MFQRDLQQAAVYHANRKEVLWQLLDGQWDKLGTSRPLCPYLFISIQEQSTVSFASGSPGLRV